MVPTRRQVIQGLAASVAPAMLTTPARALVAQAVDGAADSPPGPPAVVRSRFVDNINGLRMHVLEAGFEGRNRPGVILLHGFPELAHSWRKVMVPLASAGYHAIAPDVR